MSEFYLTFFHRLQQVAVKEGFSLSRFIEHVGLSSSTVSQAKARKAILSEESIQKILTRYPKYSRDWLVDGIGPMEISTQNSAVIQQIAQGNGHTQTVAVGEDPCAALRLEIEYLRKQVADKDKIIALLEAQQKNHEKPIS